jgi:hypothetical protein
MSSFTSSVMSHCRDYEGAGRLYDELISARDKQNKKGGAIAAISVDYAKDNGTYEAGSKIADLMRADIEKYAEAATVAAIGDMYRTALALRDAIDIDIRTIEQLKGGK